MDLDVLALCCAAAGERSANVAAHVAQTWRDAVCTVWPDGWSTDAAALLTSAERFVWAESVGCRFEGRRLLRAAARHGALDVLRVVAPRYGEWDAGATAAAAAADQLEVLLAHDPDPDPKLLYAAGPRVRALFPHAEYLDPERDFRRLMRDVVRLEPNDGRTFGQLWGSHPDTRFSYRATMRLPVDRTHVRAVVCLPRHPDILHDISLASGSIRAVVTPHGSRYLTQAFEPERAWLMRRPLELQLIVDVDDDATEADLTFTGIYLPPTQRTACFYGPWSDDRVRYESGSFRYHYELDDE